MMGKKKTAKMRGGGKIKKMNIKNIKIELCY